VTSINATVLRRLPTLADFSLNDQIVQYADSAIALYREKDGWRQPKLRANPQEAELWTSGR
jgi:hypothetical protein